MKQIISLLSAALLVAGSKAADIRGYVVDAETGEALAASNVFVKGTTAGTTADVRGYFEINVADGTELTAAYVGYTPSSFTAESGNKAIEIRFNAARSCATSMSTVRAQTSACSRRRCRLRLCQPHKSSNYLR